MLGIDNFGGMVGLLDKSQVGANVAGQSAKTVTVTVGNLSGLGTADQILYVGWRATMAATITKLSCYQLGGTATALNAYVNTGKIATTDQTPSTGAWTAITTGFTTTGVAIGDVIYAKLVTHGSATQISIQVEMSPI